MLLKLQIIPISTASLSELAIGQATSERNAILDHTINKRLFQFKTTEQYSASILTDKRIKKKK